MPQTPSPDKDKASPIPRRGGGGGFAGGNPQPDLCMLEHPERGPYSTGNYREVSAHTDWDQDKPQEKSQCCSKPTEQGCDARTSGLHKVSHNEILSQITPLLVVLSFSGTHCDLFVSREFVTV